MQRKSKSEKPVCGVCGRALARPQMVPSDSVRPTIADGLDKTYPDWRKSGWLCLEDLQSVRRRSLEDMIRRERGELTDLDRSVVASLATHETLSENVDDVYQEKLRFGDWLADRMAGFTGSWTFITLFGVVLFVWMAINVVPATFREFDPYPFILLNLVLSCIAAIQAPLIMMSQRRLETKDRLRSENDYQVNLKAELEIRHLHEKIDHHLVRQWERLAEIQEMQLELLESTANSRRR